MLRAVQGAVWFGLIVVFHELAPETSMMAAAILAFLATAALFFIPYQLWLLLRRAKSAWTVNKGHKSRSLRRL